MKMTYLGESWFYWIPFNRNILSQDDHLPLFVLNVLERKLEEDCPYIQALRQGDFTTIHGKDLSNSVTHHPCTDDQDVLDPLDILYHPLTPLPGRRSSIHTEDVSCYHCACLGSKVDCSPYQILWLRGTTDGNSLHEDLVHFFIFEDRLF
jgi:hypothetical protein